MKRLLIQNLPKFIQKPAKCPYLTKCKDCKCTFKTRILAANSNETNKIKKNFEKFKNKDEN